MFSAESKSALAKLLAEENIHVQHKKTKTAYFDLKSRTLVCPIWQSMSGALYDLLMGHEVGHALYTPEQGWHDAVKSNEKESFHTFLNVLEDARIEKKMKRKFPGLVLSFREGYEWLRKENFFGVAGKDLSKLPLIDRLNLYAKSGATTVPFDADEEVYVKRMDDLETWSEVYQLAVDLYGKAEEELEQQPDSEELYREFMDVNEGGGDQDADSTRPDDLDDVLSGAEQGSASDGEDDADESDASQDSIQDATPRRQPTSLTDEYYRRQQDRLLSKDNFDLQYVTMPSGDVSKIVTPALTALAELRAHYDNVRTQMRPKMDELYRDFMERNQNYIALLAKEFEMKKAATTYHKSKQSDTGDLNINKLYRYRLLDDVIFKKRTKVYKGKNHGIVLLLDKSGSMHSMIRESIEQVLILALFCRKVQIPFSAYSFHSHSVLDKSPWTYRVGDLRMGHLSMREMINSSLRAAEFMEMIKYQLYMGLSYDSPQYYSVPVTEHLQGTPLNESLVVMDQIVTAFRAKHRVEIAHLIIVQDGQSDGNRYITGEKDTHDWLGYVDRASSNTQLKTVIVDRDSNASWMVDDSRGGGFGLTAGILKWLSHRTGVNVFGFYLIPQGIRGGRYFIDSMACTYRDKHGSSLTNSAELDTLKAQFRENRYLESFADGYKRFCYIQNKPNAEADDLDSLLKGATTKGRISSAFSKMYEKKSTNRMVATKFIPLVAVE